MRKCEEIKIGKKAIGNYITACIVALNKDDINSVKLLGRGFNVKTAIDVAAIMKRELKKPEIEIEIGSEDYDDRKISTIEIYITGYVEENYAE